MAEARGRGLWEFASVWVGTLRSEDVRLWLVVRMARKGSVQYGVKWVAHVLEARIEILGCSCKEFLN